MLFRYSFPILDSYPGPPRQFCFAFATRSTGNAGFTPPFKTHFSNAVRYVCGIRLLHFKCTLLLAEGYLHPIVSPHMNPELHWGTTLRNDRPATATSSSWWNDTIWVELFTCPFNHAILPLSSILRDWFKYCRTCLGREEAGRRKNYCRSSRTRPGTK